MTSTALAPRPPLEAGAQADIVHLIHPDTGEILDLVGASDDQLARWRRAVMDWEARAKQAKQLCDRELVARMDARNCHTIHIAKGEDGAPSIDISAPAATTKIEYDGELLYEGLCSLVDEGELAQEAADEAVKRILVYKPDARKVAGLLKRGGRIAETMQTCGEETEVPRRVSLKAAS